MTSPKPKSRKVAWVVLGVVVVGVAISVAAVWDQVWLKVAYVPRGPVIQISSGTVLSNVHNAHTVQTYALRNEWFPGSRFLQVFCDQAGREIVRSPGYLVRIGCR